MSWRSIGEGESSPLTNMEYHPIVWPQRPVYNTYGAIMSALKSILDPINERLDPSYRLRQMQLAEYMSPQAVQLRQRTQALQAQALGLQGEKIGMEKELLPTEKAKRQAMAEATTRGMKEGSGWHLGPDGKFHENALGDTIVDQRSKLPAGPPPAQPAQTQPAGGGVGPVLHPNFNQPRTFAPIVPPPDVRTDNSQLNNDNQVAMTPQGIVNPQLKVDPGIMNDPYA